ncbi:hypothetical protein [Halorubrum yunnanense]|uniref:Uncharacterized protein n=1 Tax=Halorubrum yunnanense TaxID=1526162 RepID=A0ABD5YHN7_9EURY|nr:hypothetical protein [Halorubrum yunnanense]
MQTGTIPARRIATEPASDRSAPPTGPCRTATTASVESAPTSVSAALDVDAVGLVEVAA